MNTEARAGFAGSRRAGSGMKKRNDVEVPRLYCLDGGYIVFEPFALSRGPAALMDVAMRWREYHVTAISAAPKGAGERLLTDLGGAAQAFDRIVICESPTTGAARFAKAVRQAGRTECHVVADRHRALRHCIEDMIPGTVIVYCCDDVAAAARIVEEYGARPVRGAGAVDHDPLDSESGVHVALRSVTGEITVVHA